MKHNRGFTLLELSVVLTIIALMMGTVFAAQSIIRASQMRSMLGEYDNYVKAIKEFQDKYLALPGDMVGAEAIWGTAPGGCPETANFIFKKETCDGDANGSIGDSTENALLGNRKEWFRAWQHLSDAGFIRETFTGTQGAVWGQIESVPGTNVPASKLRGGGWTLNYYRLTSDGDLWGEPGGYGHLLNFGAPEPNGYTTSPTLSASEALSFDQKIDDGKPGTGKIRAWRTNVLPDCTTDDTTQDAQTYSSENSASQVCSLVMILGF